MLRIRETKKHEPDRASWIGPAPWIETPPPGILAQAAIERGRRLTSPSYARVFPLVASRARGSVIEDVDGNRFLDFAAGVSGCVTGHTTPKVVAAIRDQAATLIHPSGCDCYTEPMIDLAEQLAGLAPGRVNRRVLFTNSGAEAVEAAFKLSRQHTGRQWVVAFEGSFHGRTMGALSLSRSQVRETRGFGPLVPMVAHAPYGDIEGLDKQVFQQQAAPDEVAAIFVEPILAMGGSVLPPKNFLPRLRALCDRHGILLVCDEIQSGMGRTGKMFACQHYGVVPDLLLCARGLAGGMPLGAVIASQQVMESPSADSGGTFCSNSVSSAAALATLELLEGGLTANAARMGEMLLDRLTQLADKHRCLASPRGLGLMTAVDVVSRKTGKGDPRLRDRITDEAFRHGLIVLPGGPAGIRFCPALSINATQIDVGLNVFAEVVATVAP